MKGNAQGAGFLGSAIRLRIQSHAGQAAAALDDRNFGVANDDMNEAVRALEAVTLPEGDPRAAALAEAIGAARALDISVASNLGPQREALLALARQVTRLAEPAPAPVAA